MHYWSQLLCTIDNNYNIGKIADFELILNKEKSGMVNLQRCKPCFSLAILPFFKETKMLLQY